MSKKNLLTVNVILGLILVWWLGLYFNILKSSSEALLLWSTCGQAFLVLAVYCGFVAYTNKQIVELRDRKIILVVTLSAAAQVIALALFSYYTIKYKENAPYPTLADLFYAIISLCDVVVACLVASNFFRKAKFWLVFVPLWSIFLYWCYRVMVQYGYVPAWRLTQVADAYYTIFESFASILGFSAVIISRGFAGARYRSAYLFIVAALIFQFFSNFYFINAARAGTWINGGFDDILYLSAYFCSCCALLLFLEKAATVEMSLLFLNAFLFAQTILSSNTNRFSSDLIVLILSVGISIVLWKRSRHESTRRELDVRLSALEESNQKLLELDKQKTEFLNIAAHQLRTPVSVIRNYISMIEDGDFGVVPESLKEVHGHIYQSNQWLVRLADEFLDISRLESGQQKYHMEQGDLGRAVDGVVAEIKPKIDKKGLKFAYLRPPRPMRAVFDEEKIKHAAMNLLENAVKYTPEGGITITVSGDQKRILVSVQDTGIGFCAEDQPNLFQKFRRGKNAHQIEVNTSTGLGLYICRRFVEGQGGGVWAKSEGEGKGAEFGFWVPARL